MVRRAPPHRLPRRTSPRARAPSLSARTHLAGKSWVFCRRVSLGSRAWQRAQLVAAALVAQEASLLVPGAEHDTLCRLTIELEIVDARPVSMTVNQAADAGGTEGRRDRLRIDVHDVGHGARGVSATPRPGLVRELLAMRARQREEAPLPGGLAHDAAQLLIGVIVGAQRIAMRDQHALTIELRDHGVRQQLAAAALAEPRAEEEIAV